jgi:FkbM family methyltransferase
LGHPAIGVDVYVKAPMDSHSAGTYKACLSVQAAGMGHSALPLSLARSVIEPQARDVRQVRATVVKTWSQKSAQPVINWKPRFFGRAVCTRKGNAKVKSRGKAQPHDGVQGQARVGCEMISAKRYAEIKLRQWRQRVSARSAICSRLHRSGSRWTAQLRTKRPFVPVPSGGLRQVAFSALGTDLATYVDVVLKEIYNPYWMRITARLQATYARLLDAGERPLVVDAGANVGLAAAYFLTVFPHSVVASIEPEQRNFDLLRANIEIDDRAFALRAALGGRAGAAAVVDPGHGQWGFQTVRDALAPSPCPIVTVPQIVDAARDRFGKAMVPWLVKIDIEGFEDDVFSGDTGWISTFPLLVVELHDWMLPGRGSSRSFLRCMGEERRDFLWRGENVWSVSHDAYAVD